MVKAGAAQARQRMVQQTPEQMLGIVKMINAAFGGTIVNKSKH